MAKKIITKKQETILILILTFRFITSKQIQQFLRHKDHRRINSWLKDLTEKGLIIREYKPIYGTLTKPAVCFLSTQGRAYIRDTLYFFDDIYLARLRGDKDRSKSFRIRCQLVADFYLIIFAGKEQNFIESLKKQLEEGVIRKENTDKFFTPAFYSELQFVLLSLLKPDAYIVKETQKGITHSCIFVLDAYVPRLMLQYTLKRIFEVLNEEYWEDDNVLSLQLYFICPNNMVIVYLRRLLTSYMDRYYASKPLQFYFTTRNQLYKNRENPEKIKWIIVSSTDEY